MIGLLLKRLMLPIFVLALVGVAGTWIYGFVGVKAGWIGPTEVPSLNAISKSGAEAAGGVAGAFKSKMDL